MTGRKERLQVVTRRVLAEYLHIITGVAWGTADPGAAVHTCLPVQRFNGYERRRIPDAALPRKRLWLPTRPDRFA